MCHYTLTNLILGFEHKIDPCATLVFENQIDHKPASMSFYVLENHQKEMILESGRSHLRNRAAQHLPRPKWSNSDQKRCKHDQKRIFTLVPVRTFPKRAAKSATNFWDSLINQFISKYMHCCISMLKARGWPQGPPITIKFQVVKKFVKVWERLSKFGKRTTFFNLQQPCPCFKLQISMFSAKMHLLLGVLVLSLVIGMVIAPIRLQW